MSPIVIIGFGAAGYAALMAIKRCDPRREVVVIDSKEYELMHPCGIPYSLEGVVPAEKLYQNINLAAMKVTRINARAEAIDPVSKIIRTDSSKNKDVPFGTLILTPGSCPVYPPVAGIDDAIGKGFFTLTCVDDLKMIQGQLPGMKKGVVIGAGAIGLEAACALRKHLDEVTVIEMKEHVLTGVLDTDMAQLTEEHLAEMGIHLLLATRVDAIISDDRFKGVQAGGTILDADICICAAGFAPDLSLARSCGIAVDRNGITVDTMLKTSVSDVFAAGDVISCRSIIDGDPIPAKLATSAYRQGTIAGMNAAGGHEVYRGSAGTFVTEIGGLEVAGAGFTSDTAKARGFDPVIGKIRSGILPEYFPGNENISVKIIFDRSAGKILGAQAVGRRGAAERINVVSAAIEFGASVDDLSRVELAYCPAVSEVYDPLLRAADFGIRRWKR